MPPNSHPPSQPTTSQRASSRGGGRLPPANTTHPVLPVSSREAAGSYESGPSAEVERPGSKTESRWLNRKEWKKQKKREEKERKRDKNRKACDGKDRDRSRGGDDRNGERNDGVRAEGSPNGPRSRVENDGDAGDEGDGDANGSDEPMVKEKDATGPYIRKFSATSLAPGKGKEWVVEQADIHEHDDNPAVKTPRTSSGSYVKKQVQAYSKLASDYFEDSGEDGEDEGERSRKRSGDEFAPTKQIVYKRAKYTAPACPGRGSGMGSKTGNEAGGGSLDEGARQRSHSRPAALSLVSDEDEEANNPRWSAAPCFGDGHYDDNHFHMFIPGNEIRHKPDRPGIAAMKPSANGPAAAEKETGRKREFGGRQHLPTPSQPTYHGYGEDQEKTPRDTAVFSPHHNQKSPSPPNLGGVFIHPGPPQSAPASGHPSRLGSHHHAATTAAADSSSLEAIYEQEKDHESPLRRLEMRDHQRDRVPVSEPSGKIGAMDDGTRNAEVRGRVAEVEDNRQYMENRAAMVEKRIKMVEGRMERAGARMQAMAERVQAMENMMRETEDMVDRATDEGSAVQMLVVDAGERARELRERVDMTDDRVGTRLERLEQNYETLAQNVSRWSSLTLGVAGTVGVCGLMIWLMSLALVVGWTQ